MPEPDIQTPPTKVTFSPEQQVKVDELIRESMGRAGSEAKATASRLQAETEVLRAEVARLNGDKSGLETNLTAKDKESRVARTELIAEKKRNVIQAAATEHNFFNPQIVSKLTEEKIKWDEGKQSFIVLGDDGSERLGPDGNSLSVSAFLKEFGQQNNFLLRGDVKTGVGSSESIRYVTVNQRTRLTELFGKGSSAQKANALAIGDAQRRAVDSLAFRVLG